MHQNRLSSTTTRLRLLPLTRHGRGPTTAFGYTAPPCQYSRPSAHCLIQVHSYPNVQYESIQLPTQLSNVKSFQLNASWSVYPSDQYSATTDVDALNAIGTKADIALDMFLDADETKATNASAADFEVMVWGAVWGGVWPIGYYEPTTGAPNYTLGDTTL